MSSFHVLQHYTSHLLLGSLETRLQHLSAGEGDCPAWRALHSPGSFSRAVCSEHSRALAQCEQRSSHLRICEGKSQVLPLLQKKKIRWVVFALSQQLTHQLCKQQHQHVEQSPGLQEFMIQEKDKEEQQEKQDTEANAGKVSPPGTGHRAAPAWSLTAMREKERSFWCSKMGRFKGREGRFGAFWGNPP